MSEECILKLDWFVCVDFSVLFSSDCRDVCGCQIFYFKVGLLSFILNPKLAEMFSDFLSICLLFFHFFL